MIGALVGKILGSGIGNIADGVAGAIDRFVETDEEKKAAELLLIKMQQEPDKWQVEVNKIEAGHRSLFVAGWRPGAGWVCVAGLAYAAILRPLFIFTLKVIAIFTEVPEALLSLPVADTASLMTLLFAMLGLSSMRTHEKKHGLTR